MNPTPDASPSGNEPEKDATVPESGDATPAKRRSPLALAGIGVAVLLAGAGAVWFASQATAGGTTWSEALAIAAPTSAIIDGRMHTATVHAGPSGWNAGGQEPDLTTLRELARKPIVTSSVETVPARRPADKPKASPRPEPKPAPKPAPKPVSRKSDLQFTGPVTWKIEPRYNDISLILDKVTNLGNKRSRDITLELWASEEPYRGKAISAQQLGKARLPPLDPNQSHRNLKRKFAYHTPVTGEYYISLHMKEDGKYVTHANFDGKTKLFRKTAYLTGGYSFQTYPANGSLRLDIDEILNIHRDSTSGSLKLELHAMRSHPDKVASQKYWILATDHLKPLKPGNAYKKYRNTLRFGTPPRGSYYVVLVLYEYIGNEFVLTDFTVSDKRVKF